MSECAGCGRPLADDGAECPVCNGEGAGAIGKSRRLAESGVVHHMLLWPIHYVAIIAVIVLVVYVIASRLHEFVPALGTATAVVIGILGIAFVLGRLFSCSSERRL